MSRRVPTLRSHLVIVVLGVLLPGTIFTGLVAYRTAAQSRQVIERRLLDAARVDADALDREFDDAIRVLTQLALSDSLARGDLKTFHEEARRTCDARVGWFQIVLADRSGQQVLHTGVEYGTALEPAVDQASLQQLFQTGRPTVGNQITGTRLRRPGFALRVPVRRNGEIVYALTAVVDPASLQRLIVSQLASPDEWARAFIDPGFTIAARSRDNERFAGTASSAEAIAQFSSAASTIQRRINRDGLSVYVATGRSSWGWTAAIIVPATLIDAPALASVRGLAIGGALLVTFGLVSVLFVSRRLSRDLESAGAAAAALADGQPPPPFQAHVAEGQQLHDSLAVAGQLLQVRERAKDEFLAVLGHELRNPLAPATTALELMRLRGETTMVREREILERQISHLTRLVDDLLDVSRLARDKVVLRHNRFELRAAVDRAIDMAQPLIAQHRHELRVEVPATGLVLDADEDRIVQILVNLLTNAAKYTASGGHIALTAASQGGFGVVTVEDDGPGVPQDLLPTIFEPFVQGPRTFDRYQGGLGLGLALARNLARLHDGSLTFERVRPHGSRFIVRLPLSSSAAQLTVTQDDGEPVSSTKQRILVVDDNTDASEMLKRALETLGHDVQVASSGEAALAMAVDAPIDAVVLDIGLPGMNGFEVADRLRAICPHVRLIALTGYGQPADAEATRRAGFHAHCTKPVTVSTLLQHLDGITPKPPSAQRSV